MSEQEGQDGATEAFQQLLGEANEREEARVRALIALSQRTVFAATWPDDPDQLRTLTSGKGETAMPLFTAADTLEEAARRFGWTGSDGRLHWRELGAREAMRYVVAHGVQFVVIDMGCEHSVEFMRDEIEPLLTMTVVEPEPGREIDERPTEKLARAVRNSTRPPPALKAFSEPAVPAAPRGLALDIDDPFAKKAPPLRASAAPVKKALAKAKPPMPLSEPAPARATNKTTDAFPSAQSVDAFDAPEPAMDTGFDEPKTDAFPRVDVARELPSVPPARPYEDGQAFASARPPMSSPSAPDQIPPTAKLPSLASPGSDTSAYIDGGETVGATIEEAVRRASEPANPLALGNTVPAKAEPLPELGAEPLPELGAEPEPEPEPEPAPEPQEEPSGVVATQPEAPKPPAQAPAADAAADALTDDAIDAISDLLRGYPEVEWACELGDMEVGLRVDPSFLQRLGEITDGCLAAAGNSLVVTLLDDPEQMRAARGAGTVFYPGRRRKARA